MKKIIIALFTASALLLGLMGCDKEVDIKELEQSLVGIWWDAYEYSDITETGVAFDKVLLAVKADANHSGCLYLGAYDSKSDALVAVYGGPEDAGFKWELTGKGDIVLSDPATGESTVLTRADGGSSYHSRRRRQQLWQRYDQCQWNEHDVHKWQRDGDQRQLFRHTHQGRHRERGRNQ